MSLPVSIRSFVLHPISAYFHAFAMREPFTHLPWIRHLLRKLKDLALLLLLELLFLLVLSRTGILCVLLFLRGCVVALLLLQLGNQIKQVHLSNLLLFFLLIALLPLQFSLIFSFDVLKELLGFVVTARGTLQAKKKEKCKEIHKKIVKIFKNFCV